MSADDCEFCEISAGRATAQIVYEDVETIAFFPLEPAAPGHTLVVPRLHVRDFLDLSPQLAQAVGLSILRVGHALRRVLVPDGMNLITSAGEAATQTVFHLHYHLVPRWYGDAIGDIWPPAQPSVERINDDIVGLVRRQAMDGDVGGMGGTEQNNNTDEDLHEVKDP